MRIFLGVHHRYLIAEGNLKKAFESAQRELRRALHLTPSSEKRRQSGSPLAGLPSQDGGDATTSPAEKLEHEIAEAQRLVAWHRELKKRHGRRSKKLKERLAKMTAEKTQGDGSKKGHQPERLEDIELEQTPEEIAADAAATERFIKALLLGSGADPVLKSVNETLMPGGTVRESEEHVTLPAEVPEDLADARVVKTLNEHRVRYDVSFAVNRIDLEVEKKVVVDGDGERHVITASTRDYGPARYGVTWETLATLAILVGQFAMPFHRLGTLFSTGGKRFTAGALSRMLHYVARRFVSIYMELATELASADVLAGDDTSCRVIEVTTHFAKCASETEKGDKPPWADYSTRKAAEESFHRCEEARRARIERRAAGDRSAKRTEEETPSLGVLIGRKLAFESPRRNGEGAKEAMHTTVVSGRSVAADPKSLIVLYRSHIGSFGNLLEHILRSRAAELRKVIVQGDLSTTNLVTAPELVARFDIRQIGCAAHARRPYALNTHEDPERCEYMLHLFLGLAIHEQRLDIRGRNRENVLAVRGDASRELWNDILELANDMTEVWSKSTTIGTAARYIIKHFKALTAYLDDPRLEPTNNLRERMLRTEKLIEGSSMFRRSLEGRFVLDVVRTILQTAVAAGVPVREYLVSVLRANEDEIAKEPSRFTPRAWAARNLAKAAATPPPVQ